MQTCSGAGVDVNKRGFPGLGGARLRLLGNNCTPWADYTASSPLSSPLILTAACLIGRVGLVFHFTRKETLPQDSPSEGLSQAARPDLTSSPELVMHEKQGRWYQDLK